MEQALRDAEKEAIEAGGGIVGIDYYSGTTKNKKELYEMAKDSAKEWRTTYAEELAKPVNNNQWIFDEMNRRAAAEQTAYAAYLTAQQDQRNYPWQSRVD